MDAQEFFKSTFKALIDEDYSISNNIQRYHDILEHALSKVDFLVGTGIYMLPSNLNLKIGLTKGYNNELLISSTEMKIGPNKEVNKEKLPEPVKAKDNAPMKKKTVKEDHLMDKSRTLTEQHNDEKLAITLLIVGAGLITYHLW